MGLARAEFPFLFSGPDRRLLPLELGEQVKRYTGAKTAVVSEEGREGGSLVDSTLPLRARDDSGALAAVDIDLERTGEGWAPANSLSPVGFGERSDAAISFPGDFKVAPAGATRSGTRVANEIFFAEVGTDIDAWFGPTQTGARVAFQLRSERAPEEVRLTVRTAPGVVLRLAPDRSGAGHGLELMRGERRIGFMTAPVAFDADERPLDVELRIEGEEVVIAIPHRGTDVRYPLAVDPVYENQDSWKYGNGNYAGWRYYESVPQFPHGNYHDCCGWGWWIARNPNQWFHRSYFAEYQYFAPNDFSYIYRADFLHAQHHEWESNNTHGMWSRMWGGFQHQYHFGYSYNATGSFWSVCATGDAARCNEWDPVNIDQSRGNYVQSSIWPKPLGWSYPSWWALVYWGGARVWMSDWEPPGLWYLSPAPTGWVHDVPASQYAGRNQAHVRYGDRGLGMWGLVMDVPGMGRQYSTDWGGCSGAHSSRCPESRAHNFSFASISQGVQTVTAHGQDVLGRWSAPDSRTLRIDRSRPAVPAGSGSLYGQRNGFVAPQAYSLGIQGSDSYSGVRGVSYRVVRQATGAQVASGSALNPGCSTTGCSTSWKPPSDFTVDASGWAAGRYTVELTVKDQLGDDPTHGTASHRSTSSFTVEMDRDPPTVSVSHEGLQPWLGDDREITSTVTGSDSGSGVKAFTLDFPSGADETRTRTCGGISTTRCPTQDSETFTYRTNAQRFPNEGRNQVRATVGDARGSTATSEPWSVNVDRTAPQITLSGALHDRRGQQLPAGAYELTAEAADGSIDSPQSERSGTRDLDVYVDGELVESRSQPCPQGSCPLTVDWTFDTDEHTGGEHTVEVRATDHLDHEEVQQFEVSTPCCLDAASSWGTLFGPLDTVVFGDADGDGFADAVTRQALTGQLTVSRSTGTSFATAQSWGTWPGPAAGAELHMADVDGDARDDLVARDPADGKLYVALSTGSSFAAPTEWGTWPGGAEYFVQDANGDGSADLVGRNEQTAQLEVAGSLYFDDGGENRFEAPTVWSGPQPGLELAPGDADFDGTADLVGRGADGSLQVGTSSTIDFQAPTAWGSLSTDQELRVGDVNADGTADAVGRNPSNGDVRFAISDGEAFAAADPVGTFDPGYPVELADVDGDGDTDLLGRHELTGDIKVALSNTRPAPVEPAPDWTPDPEIDYDDSNLFPEVGGFGIQQAAEEQPKQMQLAMEDPTHTLLRRGLVEGDPFSGEGEQAANDKIDVIYDRMNRTGTSIVRMLVYWGYFENADGTFDPEALDRLSKAVDRAKAPDNNMRVYLTLTGAARDFECQRDFNPRSRVCTDPDDPNVEPCGAPDRAPPGTPPEVTADMTPTGYNPDSACFARFVRAVVERVGDRVKTYSIWNEPNQPRFLQTNDLAEARVVPADLYRSLYRAGRDAVLQVQPNAKVMIGELASARRPGGFEAGSPNRDGVTAHEFLARAADPTGTSEGLVTDGVALHPYQHQAPPRQAGARFVAGIGKIDITQSRIDDLFDKGELCAEKRLRTPACKRPGLLYTEFGYRNRSEKRVDTLTEIERDGYYDVALRRARFNDAKWMSIYQVVEDPIEDPNDRSDEYKEEYGLFSLEGLVRGERSYGKGKTSGFRHPQERRAYCDGIYKFASAHPNQYEIAERPESGCDG